MFASIKAGVLSSLVFNSVWINILALTSPLFMLQVYDRVLASGSVPTLVGLGILAIGLYLIQAVLDILRSRLLLRVGEKFDLEHRHQVHDAVVRLPLVAKSSSDGLQPLKDLDGVRSFLQGAGPTAFFDLPWIPVFLGICFLFHFWLGVTATVGALVLVTLTFLTSASTRKSITDATSANMARNAALDAARRNAEVVRAMGMGGRLLDRWEEVNDAYAAANRSAGDLASGFGIVAKTLRIVLQSAILGVGAYLVIRQEVSPGTMIASSIMMGRAMAPVDLAISQWKPFLQARQSWKRLQDLLGRVSVQTAVTSLPAPTNDLRVEGLVIFPPGARKPTVSNVGFQLSRGQALGVIGPSGSGKSSLARALVGVWHPSQGKVRLDGASLDQWDNAILGNHIGYLPQAVELFGGTISENISRFVADPSSEDIVAAATAAGAHDIIVSMEKGYDTQIGEFGSELSAGQRQRIGLARALFGNPFLVVLDEPNANLDAEGEISVTNAIRSVTERGGIVVVIAHRPSALGVVDAVLVIDRGIQSAFGPRDEILAKMTRKVPTRQVKSRVTGRVDLVDGQATEGV